MPDRLIPSSVAYVAEIARRGSIQRTARELNVAASAINRQLLLLEAELGTPLFERLPRGMRPTPAGDAVIALARHWRADTRKLRDMIQELRGEAQGTVRIAAMDSHANGLLPVIILQLRDRHPNVSVEVQIATPDAAASLLLGEQADVSIIHNLAPNREIHAVIQEPLPLGCIVAPGHPLAGRGAVTLQQVVAHPVALQSPALPIRRFLDAKYAWLFGQQDPPVVTDSLQLVKALALSGRYAAITSELDAITELLSGSLRFVRVRDPGAEPQSVTVAVAARRASRIAQLVAGMIAEQVRHMLAQVRANQPQNPD